MTRMLFVIPARGGSKGVPKKNIKLLNGKPLIAYTIDIARQITDDEFICVSTDSDEIIKVVENYGLKVPFKRPDKLATDTAGMREVLLHALAYYERRDKDIKAVVLLQPTSPLRKPEHIKEAMSLFSEDIDMVVSVKKADANPYYNLFEENNAGFLKKSKKGNFTRRQDCPVVYQYNGSIYVINPRSLQKENIFSFSKIKKYEMSPEYSIDIDNETDWKLAEFFVT